MPMETSETSEREDREREREREALGGAVTQMFPGR